MDLKVDVDLFCESENIFSEMSDGKDYVKFLEVKSPLAWPEKIEYLCVLNGYVHGLRALQRSPFEIRN